MERLSFRPFFTQAPLFLFSAHQSHHLLPPLPSPALSHHRQASWPVLHSTAEAAWTSGPASASEIFRGPTKSCATPSRSLHAATFLCRGRYWCHGEPPPAPARWLHSQFCPWSHLPLRLEPRPSFPPLSPIKAPPDAPKLITSNLQLQQVITCTWTHHSAPTLSKPTFPQPSPPQPEATQPFPVPSSSPDHLPHHLPHRTIPLLPLPPSPLTTGNPSCKILAGSSCSPVQSVGVLLAAHRGIYPRW
jgi:hypothetical protein